MENNAQKNKEIQPKSQISKIKFEKKTHKEVVLTCHFLLHFVSKLEDNPLLSVQEEQDVLRITVANRSELYKSWIDHIIQIGDTMTY